MTGKVLVAVGTTNGSIARMAEAVAGVLCEDGLTVDVLPARSAASVSTLDAVVGGGWPGRIRAPGRARTSQASPGSRSRPVHDGTMATRHR